MDGTLSSEDRILEARIDEILARALDEGSLAHHMAAAAGLPVTSRLLSVRRQTRHAADTGTIDLDVQFEDGRLLIENKIQAAWSHTRSGIAQPERYARSTTAYGARSVLVAPRAYLEKAAGADGFDARLAYEEITEHLSGTDRDTLLRAAREAVVPTANPDVAATDFFAGYAALVEELAPHRVLKKRGRNKGSFTAHFDPKKSLRSHPGLPRPSIFQQFGQGNVKLLIREWGWQVERLEGLGLHRAAGLELIRVGKVGTLGIVAPSPRLAPGEAFEPQRDRAVEAVRSVEAICRWWDENPDTLQAWKTRASG